MTLDPQPLAPALAAAEEAGWTTLRLDLDGVRGKAALMRRCGDALRAPEWFGGNWDALADALRDLSWLPEGERSASGSGRGSGRDGGRLVAVTGWQGFAAERPEDWEVFVDVLEEAVDFWREGEGPPLAVLLAEPAATGGATGAERRRA